MGFSGTIGVAFKPWAGIFIRTSKEMGKRLNPAAPSTRDGALGFTSK
jgi:hypothetical protein